MLKRETARIADPSGPISRPETATQAEGVGGFRSRNDASSLGHIPFLDRPLAACAGVAGRLRSASAASKSKDLPHHAR